MPDMDLTALLAEWGGDAEAADQLLDAVYPELRALARRHLVGERADHTLDTSALVHEAYLRLASQDTRWANRAHFFGIAALAMRRILVDYATRKQAQKRGGGLQAVTFHDGEVARETRAEDLIALDEALGRFARVAPRPARVVELRFFGGLRVEEIADILGISPATVGRDWRLAQAWLTRALGEASPA
ncbi:hypothetical protein B1759_15455 [Rubrivirga sp. SAORIC476]|nr:hypothetical protein B1759_15455 [Rubrivirga sp. SAORIC476]